MKKLLFTFFVFMFLSSTLAQSSIECIYKITVNQPDANSSVVKSISQSVATGCKNIEFKLVANKTESQFSLIESLSLKDRDTSIALIIIGFENNIFSDLFSKEYFFNNSLRTSVFQKNEFLVKGKIFEKWSLTTETKLINNILCFKATAKVPLFALNNDKEIDAIAWYSPTIPFSTGPIGCGGLPGLIVELQMDNILYGMVDLKIFTQKNNLIRPSEGIILDVETYFNKKNERIISRVRGM